MDTDNLILDPDKIMEVGKFWEKAYRDSMTLEERLEGLTSQERLQGLVPEERLQGLTPEQIEAYLQKIKQ